MPKRTLTCDQDYRREVVDALEAFEARIHAAQAADAWTSPSPCEGWTAADVARHVTANLHVFVGTAGGAAALGELQQSAAEQDGEDDLIKGWERARAAVEQVIRDCRDPAAVAPVMMNERGMTVAFVIEALLRDVVIHTWDLARATGGNERLPAHLVTAATSALARLPEKIRQRGYYADALVPPPDASDQDRLLALAGRRSWPA